LSPGAPTPSPGATLGVASGPPGSQTPDGSGAVAIGNTAASTTPTAPGGGLGGTPAPVAGEAPTPSGEIDPIVLFLLVVIAVLVLALGFALGARRGRASA